MMNDGNPVKAKVKDWIYRVQRKRFGRLILHEGEELIRKNPKLGKKTLTKEELGAIQDQWSGLRMEISPLWHQVYKNILGSFDPKMIPMTVYYLRFEPYMRDYRLTKAYADKNAHHIFIPDANRPEMILQHVHRRFYGMKQTPLAKSQVESYIKKQEGSFFLKPAMDGNGGKHITTFRVEKGIVYKKGEPINVEMLLRPYPQNFLIQRKVLQHKEAAALHPNSVNTFRVTTIREGHKIRMLNDVMRVGVGGSEIDNASKGGMVLGVYEGGRLSERALDSRFNWVDIHPDTGISFKDFKPLSFAGKVEAEAVRLHERFPYADTICWDLTYDENDRVVVIEYNLAGFGVLYQQAFHGPYFGEKTEEWLAHMREVWKYADRQKGYYTAYPKL